MAPAIDATSGSRFYPPLVGREAKLTTLRNCLTSSVDGRGQFVLVSGEAGIGKTSLVQAVLAGTAQKDVLVLQGGCYDLSVTRPYGPWLELIRNYNPTEGFPPLPAFVNDRDALAGLQSQDALFQATLDFFVRIAERRPLTLVLEDLHWADQASLDLLRFVARNIQGQRMLLVATYRDDEVTRRHPLFTLLPLLVRESNPVRIDLPRLGASEARTLVHQRYNLSHSDAERVLTYLQIHAEGNPLYLGELLRTLQDEQVLQPTDDGWLVGDLNQVPVPQLVHQLIERRLAKVDDATRDLLQVAAVIGQEVPLELWQAVSETSDTAIATAMEQAMDANLLDELSNRTGVSFGHALVRATLYDDLVSLRRRVWHRRVAEALMAMYNPDPDQVAYHLQRAHDGRATEWLLRAAERAERTYAWRTAAERLESLLPLLEADTAYDEARGWLLLHLARLLRFTDIRQSLSIVLEARRVAAQTGDRALAVVARSMGGLIHCFLGRAEQGLQDLEAGANNGSDLTNEEWIASYRRQRSLVADFGDETTSIDSPTVDVARITSEQVGTLVLWLAIETSRVKDVVDRGERYAAQIEALDEQVLLQHTSRVEGASWIDTYLGLGQAYAVLGRPGDAMRALARANDLYRLVGHHVLAGQTLRVQFMIVNLPYHADNPRQRAQLVEEIEEMDRAASGAISGDLEAELTRMWAMFYDGHWTEVRNLAKTIRGEPRFRSRWRRLELDALRAALARHQGEIGEGWQIIQDVLPEGPGTRTASTASRYTFRLMLLAADLALESRACGVARSWLQTHDRWLDYSGAVLGRAEGMLLWAQVHKSDGDWSATAELANAALQIASDPRQPLALISIHRFLGELALEKGDLETAEEDLTTSLELTEACAIPFERALTLLALVETLVRRGNTGTAQKLLHEAREICARLGARPALERAERLTARLRPRQTEHRFGLSPREREVLQLLVKGKSDKEIAEELFISHFTVMRHVSHILAKLDVDSRTAAAAYALRTGLV